MNIRLVHASGSVEFSTHPAKPVDKGTHLLQPTEKSTGGDTFGFDPFAQDKLHPLFIPQMPKADLDDLLAFFNGPADGMNELFAYNTVDGDVYQTRFATPDIEYEEVAFETYAVRIILRED